jgi:hypothetical protein
MIFDLVGFSQYYRGYGETKARECDTAYLCPWWSMVMVGMTGGEGKDGRGRA